MTFDKHLWARTLAVYDCTIGSDAHRVRVAAERFMVGVTTLKRWIAARAATGKRGPKRKRGALAVEAVAEAHWLFLRDHLMHVDCQLYIEEMSTLVEGQFNNGGYTPAQIRDCLKRHGFTSKVMELHAREQNAAVRASYRHLLRPPHLGGNIEARQLCFVDETNMSVGMARRKYGWAYHGQPAIKRVNGSNGKAQSHTEICSFSLRGFETCDAVDGGNNAETFLAILEHSILPRMQPYPADRSVLVVDNSGVHSRLAMQALCAARGVLLFFLPPYSYDFNPIELGFHVGKDHTRRIWREGNDLVTVFRGELLRAVDYDMAANLFRHAGYYVTAQDMAAARM